MTIIDLNVAVSYPEWTEKAECTKHDPALFVSDKKGRIYDKAKKICNVCPVKQECLDWILKIESSNACPSYGIYGGLSHLERMELRTCSIRGCTNKPRKRKTGGPARWCDYHANPAHRPALPSGEDTREYPVQGKLPPGY